MSENNGIVYIYCNNSSDLTVKVSDKFEEYLGKIVSVSVNFREKPIKGKLISLGSDYIDIERLDGNHTTIRRHTVLCIKQAKEANRVPERVV